MKTTLSRPVIFALVGALGFACQLAALHLLVVGGLPVGVSTAAAVMTAVAHNFLWHRRWTWRDRAVAPVSAPAQLLRFIGLNGLVSLVGNVVITAGLAGSGMPVLAANGVAVVVCSVVNFVLADRMVFVAATVVLMTAGVADAAVLERWTVAGWQEYVKATEQRIALEEPNRSVDVPSADEWRRLRAGELLLSRKQSRRRDGSGIDVPDGAVHHWVGRVFLPGVDLTVLLTELQAPTSRRWTPAEVRSLRVVGDGGGGLRVFMRVERDSLVDVTYDIEHLVHYSAACGRTRHQPQCLAPHRATRRRRHFGRAAAARGARQRLSLALECVLAVCACRRRRSGGVRVACPEPERAVNAAAAGRPDDRSGVARIAGKHARRVACRLCVARGQAADRLSRGLTQIERPLRFEHEVRTTRAPSG